jgi:hypothetical protein
MFQLLIIALLMTECNSNKIGLKIIPEIVGDINKIHVESKLQLSSHSYLLNRKI